MSHDVYYQFLQHPGQARRAGARGGQATVRNRRERLDCTPVGVPEPEEGPNTVTYSYVRPSCQQVPRSLRRSGR